MQAEKTTHIRIYRKDAARLDALLRTGKRTQPSLSRPDIVRRLLDSWEAVRDARAAEVRP